jgi:hypothetical protein
MSVNYQCCPFARSGGYIGCDCTCYGKPYCAFIQAAKWLKVPQESDKIDERNVALSKKEG